MSSWIQSNPSSSHQHIDDLESFMHVNNWLAMRFMRNSLHDYHSWSNIYMSYFDPALLLFNGQRQANASKQVWIFSGMMDMRRFVVEGHGAITELLQSTRKLFINRYLQVPCEVNGRQMIDLFASCLASDDWPTKTEIPAFDHLPSRVIEPDTRIPNGSRSSNNISSGLASIRSSNSKKSDRSKRAHSSESGEEVEVEVEAHKVVGSAKRSKVEEGS
jgi:hypothetical protein